jgi:hypothetical protein
VLFFQLLLTVLGSKERLLELVQLDIIVREDSCPLLLQQAFVEPVYLLLSFRNVG